MRRLLLLIGFIFLIIFLIFVEKSNAMTKTQQFFTDLSSDTMHLVEDYYAEDIEFHDPMVSITGVENMRNYYEGVYAGPEEVSFEYLSEIQVEQELVLIWRMTFVNDKFNKGRPVVVDGSSHIKFNDEGKAYYHRDYFDMGEMVYKYVPVLRSMIKMVNKRIAKSHAKH